MVYVKAAPQPGILHEYAPKLTAFEFGATRANNVVVFVGGLGDGLLTVPYVPRLAQAIQSQTSNEWTVVQALISASYTGWGTSSLARDTKELNRLVEYLKTECSFSKVVLMGHLTGCQDTLYYLSKTSGYAVVDGAILQAPVSDREGFASAFKDHNQLEELLKVVKTEYIDQNKGHHLLPQEFREKLWNFPITAYRYYSLISKRGDDDFFSSYLTAADYSATFGKITAKLLVLYGEKDEFVPDFVDKAKLLKSWQDATDSKYWSAESKVLKGAIHNVGPGSDKESEDDLIATVIRFIATI